MIIYYDGIVMQGVNNSLQNDGNSMRFDDMLDSCYQIHASSHIYMYAYAPVFRLLSLV